MCTGWPAGARSKKTASNSAGNDGNAQEREASMEFKGDGLGSTGGSDANQAADAADTEASLQEPADSSSDDELVNM